MLQSLWVNLGQFGCFISSGRCGSKGVDRRGVLLEEPKQCPGMHSFEGPGLEEEERSKF